MAQSPLSERDAIFLLTLDRLILAIERGNRIRATATDVHFATVAEERRADELTQARANYLDGKGAMP